MTIRRVLISLTVLVFVGPAFVGCDSTGCGGPPDGFSIDDPTPLAGTMRQTCRLGEDGLDCWGVATRRSERPPEASLTQIDGSTSRICGVDDQHKIHCWGARSFVEPPTRAGFKYVSPGDQLSCAIDTEDRLECWGPMFGDDGELGKKLDELPNGKPVPDGSFARIDVGAVHACGIRTDGRLACWGVDRHSAASPPDGYYTQIGCGTYHCCALGHDGRIACWGHGSSPNTDEPLADQKGSRERRAKTEDFDQAVPPSGTFADLAVGPLHNCAVDTDGRATCWGSNRYRESTPPSERLDWVAAPANNSCGLRTGGTLVCWGSNNSDKSQPPGGSYHFLTGPPLEGERWSLAWSDTRRPPSGGEHAVTMTPGSLRAGDETVTWKPERGLGAVADELDAAIATLVEEATKDERAEADRKRGPAGRLTIDRCTRFSDLRRLLDPLSDRGVTNHNFIVRRAHSNMRGAVSAYWNVDAGALAESRDDPSGTRRRRGRPSADDEETPAPPEIRLTLGGIEVDAPFELRASVEDRDARVAALRQACGLLHDGKHYEGHAELTAALDDYAWEQLADRVTRYKAANRQSTVARLVVGPEVPFQMVVRALDVIRFLPPKSTSSLRTQRLERPRLLPDIILESTASKGTAPDDQQ